MGSFQYSRAGNGRRTLLVKICAGFPGISLQ
jgi:hypothetical protein